MFVSYRHKLVGTQRIVAIVVKMCLDQQAKQTLKTLSMVIKHGPLQQGILYGGGETWNIHTCDTY